MKKSSDKHSSKFTPEDAYQQMQQLERQRKGDREIKEKLAEELEQKNREINEIKIQNQLLRNQNRMLEEQKRNQDRMLEEQKRMLEEQKHMLNELSLAQKTDREKIANKIDREEITQHVDFLKHLAHQTSGHIEQESETIEQLHKKIEHIDEHLEHLEAVSRKSNQQYKHFNKIISADVAKQKQANMFSAREKLNQGSSRGSSEEIERRHRKNT